MRARERGRREKLRKELKGALKKMVKEAHRPDGIVGGNFRDGKLTKMFFSWVTIEGDLEQFEMMVEMPYIVAKYTKGK